MESFDKSQKFFKKFRAGYQVAISNSAYAYLYNQFLRNSKLENIKGYDKKKLKNDNKIKRARPIIIIYNSKESDKLIAISQSESNTKTAKKYNYINQDNKIWKSEILVLDKSRTILFKRGKVYNKYPKVEVEKYLDFLENKHPKIFEYLNENISQIKNK